MTDQQQPYRDPTTQVYVGYQPSPPRGLSVASMVLGIVSIFFGFTFVVPLTGLILGIAGFRKEAASQGMAIAGLDHERHRPPRLRRHWPVLLAQLRWCPRHRSAL